MLPKTLNEWLALGGTLIACIATCIACFHKTRKWFNRLRESVRCHSRFVEHFSPEYPTAIHELISDLGSAQDLHEAHYRIILRRLGIGIFVCEATGGKCLHVTDRLAEIFGMSPDSMLGFGWAAQVNDRAARVENWNWCVAHQLTYRDNYTVTNAATGKNYFCHSEAFYLAVDGGRYVGYVEVIREEVAAP